MEEKMSSKKQLEENVNYLKERIEKLKRSRNVYYNCFFGLVGIILLAFLVLTTINTSAHYIDKNKFCKEKLNTFYPEYKWTGATYNYNGNDHICDGSYSDSQQDNRNGFAEVGEKTVKHYQVIDQKEIDYLNSGGKPALIFILGAIVSLLILAFVWLFSGMMAGEL
jgi:hypothetical protein